MAGLDVDLLPVVRLILSNGWLIHGIVPEVLSL